LGELMLEVDAAAGEREMALAPVARARFLLHIAEPDQLLQHAAEALLGDPQRRQQFCDGDAGLASDKINGAMMRAAEAVACEDGVRITGKVAIGKEQELDALAELLVAQIEQVGSRLRIA